MATSQQTCPINQQDPLPEDSLATLVAADNRPRRWGGVLSKIVSHAGPWLSSCAVALGVGCWLIYSAAQSPTSPAASLTNTLILLGLDPERALMVGALVFCLAAALVGTLVGWRREMLAAFGALVGAVAALCLAYIMPFVQREMQPTRDPGGALEPLNQGMLAHNVLVILALGGLCAFAGLGIGRSLRQLVLLPCGRLGWRLGKSAWQAGAWLAAAVARRPRRPAWREMLRPLASLKLWAAPVAIVTGLYLAFLALSNAGTLLLYSPDYGVHRAAPLPIINGVQAQSGQVVQTTYPSPAMGGQKRQVAIYLPPSYNDPLDKARRYPVLYVLHGTPGGPNDWFAAGHLEDTANQLIARHEIGDMIIVSPDGRGRPGASPEWGNSADGHQRLEDSIAFDLVQYIDSHYRTLASATYRAIGGLSSGGFGAMNIASHHPDIFGAVISLGGYYQAEGTIWGTQLAYRQENSPLYVFPRRPDDWMLAIFLGAADKDQPYYSDTKAFSAELAQLHVSYHLDVEHGAHSWGVWAKQMWNALLWLHGINPRW